MKDKSRHDIIGAIDDLLREFLEQNMRPQMPIRKQERENWSFFLSLPVAEAAEPVAFNITKNVQLLQPMFEFPTACAGCGETPYLRLFSQLFGDRAVISNATGCSSIYGANLPGTPWAVNDAGRGPAPVCRGQRPADHLAARPYRSALVCRKPELS